MELYLSLAGILGALLIGAMSPGPSFVLVARTSIAVSRADGLYMALGMGVGAVVFAVLVLVGLQALLATVPWIYLSLKILGGLYLIYIALQIWADAKQPMAVADRRDTRPQNAARSFLLALFTQLSNPKAVVIYGSIFAALLPPDMPLPALLALPFLIFVVEAGWYTAVAIALSSPSSSAFYLGSKLHIDRFASLIMGALGIKLLVDAKQISDL